MDDWQQVSDPLAPFLAELERKMKANQLREAEEAQRSAKRLTDYEKHAEESQWFA